MSRPLGASRATVLLFTWAAGSVDAITYLRAHVFTANMTGNAVLFGLAVGDGKWTAAVSSVIALVAFVAGVALGAVAVGQGDRVSASSGVRDVRRAVWLQTFILLFFAAAGWTRLPLPEQAAVLVLIVSSGFAMGLQSAAVRRLQLPGIATTYITGTITSLFSGLVYHWRSRVDSDVALNSQTTGAATVANPPANIQPTLRLQALVFLTYTIAAVACAALHMRWPSAVTLLPLTAIVAVDISLARHQTAG